MKVKVVLHSSFFLKILTKKNRQKKQFKHHSKEELKKE